MQDRAGEQDDEHRERGVLKVRELHLHWSELHTPANGGARRRWLETKGLPVGGLNVLCSVRCQDRQSLTVARWTPHLKMVVASAVILVYSLREYYQGITNK